MLRLARSAVVLILAVSGLPACTSDSPLHWALSYIPETVNIQYHSITSTAPISGASQVTVYVQVADGRTDHSEQVGRKKHGAGWETAAISSAHPVPEIVRQAIVEELRKKGFQVGPSRVTLMAEVNRFSNDYKLIFLGADALGEVTLSVQVRAPAGRILYTRILTGRAKNGDLWRTSMGGGNARIALEAALASVLSDLMSDQAFVRAVLNAGRGGASKALTS